MFQKLDPARPCTCGVACWQLFTWGSITASQLLCKTTSTSQPEIARSNIATVFSCSKNFDWPFSSTFQVESFRTACWIRFATMGELLLQFNWTTNLRLLSNCVWLVGSCCNLQLTDVSPNRFRLLPLIGELLNGGAVHLPPGQLWLMKRWRSFPHFFKWRSSQLWLMKISRSFPLFFKWRSSQQALVHN